jgi:pimeloyl-ACP methyl ester carboxylesterase
LLGRHTLISYADVVEQLRCHLGLARFTLLGHSLGGSISLVFASWYGTALDAVCLLNPVIDAATAAASLGRPYYGVCVRLPQALGRAMLTSRLAVYLADRAVFTGHDRATQQRILHAACPVWLNGSTRSAAPCPRNT